MNAAYPLDGLAAIIAQVVHFARDDYTGSPSMPATIPENVLWNISYVVACFLAQHTRFGEAGVEAESAYVGMEVATDMTYTARLRLAERLVREWSI